MTKKSFIISGTEQEVFDHVCEHLAQQKRRAVDDAGSCVYRAEDGLKCAIGCFIPDNKYAKLMEGKAIHILELEGRFNSNLDIVFLSQLQVAHDTSYSSARLKDHLRSIAYTYGLNKAKIDLITEWS